MALASQVKKHGGSVTQLFPESGAHEGPSKQPFVNQLLLLMDVHRGFGQDFARVLEQVDHEQGFFIY